MPGSRRTDPASFPGVSRNKAAGRKSCVPLRQAEEETTLDKKKDGFLESKIQTPTAPRNFLVREPLIQRLNDAEERLIIISAGMGYGKTVLLTHYAKR